MSSKRKWDQPAPDTDETTTKFAKTEESKTASEVSIVICSSTGSAHHANPFLQAAAAAAAIASKIAAQFAGPMGSPMGGNGLKDMHDGEFVHDIDINDVRNRYMLTKGSTQIQVRIL